MKVVCSAAAWACGSASTPRTSRSRWSPIGYRPILWHLMKYYAHYGHKDFILCLGYKADVIKDYFLNYNECVSNDFVLSDGGGRSAAQQRHPRLDDHVRRHRHATPTSASG